MKFWHDICGNEIRVVGTVFFRPCRSHAIHKFGFFVFDRGSLQFFLFNFWQIWQENAFQDRSSSARLLMAKQPTAGPLVKTKKSVPVLALHQDSGHQTVFTGQSSFLRPSDSFHRSEFISLAIRQFSQVRVNFLAIRQFPQFIYFG